VNDDAFLGHCLPIETLQSKTLIIFAHYYPITKTKHMASVEEFISHIKVEGKHGHYQLLPPALISKYPQLSQLPYNNIRLDDKRYDYFCSKLPVNEAKVTDIGANIGYFSFRLMTEKLSKVTVYEPFQAHSEVIGEIAQLLDITSESLTNRCEGISLDSIDNMNHTDILLFFNVLQHAGEDFDSQYVKSAADWRAYAVQYLSKLRQKAGHMVFQTGYSWLGHKDDLCAKSDIIPFTLQLLKEAGWEVWNVGVISNFDKPVYEDLDFRKTTKHPALGMMRLLEYGIKHRMGRELPNYRFLQRPIFICKS